MTLSAHFALHRPGFALDVELELPGRGVSGVIGPSGCGKTTLLRCLAGLEPAARGRLSLGGEVWQDGTRFLPPHRRPVGLVFQHSALFPHLTVRGNLDYARRRATADHRRLTLERAVDLTAVGPLLGRAVAGLSGGERQRVAIARSLVSSPRLLLLDEPVAALDRASRGELLPCLERLHRELDIPVVYVSHNLDEIARLADTAVILEAGRVGAAGSLGDVLTRLDLPLARSPGALAVVEATVRRHDDHDHLTELDFSGGSLVLPREDLPVGATVRVSIHARDVSLTLAPPEHTSILNVVPARVVEIADEGPAQAVVRLAAGDATLLARVTRRSAARLELSPGLEVFAQVKSVALLG